MATYRKRGNSWQYRIRYKHPATGEWIEGSKGGFKNEAEAHKAAIEEERLLMRGVDITNSQMSVESYLEWWFNIYKKNNVSAGTEKNIRNCMNRVIKEIGSVPMEKLTRPMYQQFINKIAPNYTKSTLQRMNSTISEAFSEAIHEDIIYKNPVERVSYPRTSKVTPRKNKHLEIEQYLELFELSKGDWKEKHPHYYYMMPLLVASGARIGEICALTVEDLEIIHIDEVGKDMGMLTINKTIVMDDTGWAVKPTTKTGKSGERTIGIDAFTISIMKEWLLFRKKYILKHPYAKNNYLFFNPIGRFVRPPNYSEVLADLCARHNFIHVHPHMFRHTHETIMWESGISDINFISARMGDKDKKILLETYGHMSARSEQMNMAKINEFMSRISNG